MKTEEIEKLIKEQIPDANVTVSSDDGCHFDAIIISNSFKGKSLLQRQRKVYAAVNTEIKDGIIHALSLKTYTPEEKGNN